MNTADLPLVGMDDGLLLCPSCRSMDLRLGATPDEFVCDDCGERCRRGQDQCPKCGTEGMTQIEEVGFSAPGQAPSEAPRKLVRTCNSCGYSNG